MTIRKGAVSMAIVAAVSASAATVLADETSQLSKTSVTMMDAASAPAVEAPAADAGPTHRPLMQGLDKLGAASFLDKYNINIYGWIEASYTYNHRHINRLSSVNDDPAKVGVVGHVPFNHEANDGVMGNQVGLRFERQIQSTDHVEVGGMLEVMYGEDAAAIHANGLEYGNTGDSARFHPMFQFDIPQAYVDVAVGVKGLTFRVGKFYTTMGNETINPEGNALFSHSYIFYALPFTQFGGLAMYQLNDQWKLTFGITRGWDQAFEDSPHCYPDALFQASWTPNAQWTVVLNASFGPENGGDTSHYRTTIDPIVTWKATDALSFTAEALYIYDGNFSGGNPSAYGDQWGLALYASYKINDYFTLNGRVEKFHDYSGGLAATGLEGNTNIYSFTFGCAISPFPTDPIGSGLKIRPEVRYDFGEDPVFTTSTGDGGHKEQLTFGVDIYYAF